MTAYATIGVKLLIVIIPVINYFFYNADPSHMMLVDCGVLCCWGGGPIAAVRHMTATMVH
jgi:hypothetical protein